ncbi:MAG: Ppx/GppA phosphatase family protein [Thermoleophilaceae bacterium]
MTRIAVIDFGSNTTRLLIADVEGRGLREIERRSEITRLGQGVDATGRLADEALERVYATVAEYRRLIDRHAAEVVLAVATSAVRDSANGEEFQAALRERFDIRARTISGDEEARLTFAGATGFQAGDGAPTLVIDIGGGSTEYVVGAPSREPDFHVSTQAGSVRQTERHLASDPPRGAELAALRDDVREIIRSAVPEAVRAEVRRAIAVAGTATSLAAIDQSLDPYDAAKVDGYELSRATCERLLEALSDSSLAEREQIRGLDPRRAPTIVAGAAILVESMLAFGLERVRTSEADILYGVALMEGL